MRERYFVEPPDPGRAGDLAELVDRLRLLKVWAGDPSYEEIKNRVNERWRAAGRPVAELARRTTVLDCFRPSRRRLNTDLVTAVVHALHPDHGYVAQWRQALRVIGGEVEAAAQVRIHSALPADPSAFTGRDDQLAAARELLGAQRDAEGGAAVLLVEGMAGVGKTHLVTRLAHQLRAELAFDQVLFVDLRGHHPDPAQPPADPTAVLDGFLRVLGVPGRTVPQGTAALSAAFRAATATTRVLVVLDNATSGEQVAAVLPDGPGCVTLVTSRRRLTGLPGSLSPAACLVVDVFASAEALDFLATAAPAVPVGTDPEAPARIAHSCGYLPLALGLVAGQMRRRTGWTLTEHADRLEERRRARQLESAVEAAFDLSYRLLRARHQRLLRLFAVQPAHDLDELAVAALTGTAPETARADLADLADEHVLHRTTADRYTCHDLVRVFAAARAADEDPPSVRRGALARLVRYHLGATAVAMDRLYPAEAHRRPRVDPPGTPLPDLADALTARAWLDGERAALVDVAVHGQPEQTARLSALLFRYLDGGHHLDALAVHGHACRSDDPAQRAHALTNVGTAHLQLGRYDEATTHLEQALELFTRSGDRVGQARVLGNLGLVAERLGRYEPATCHLQRVLSLFRVVGDRTGEAHSLTNLGVVEERRGRLEQALEHHEQALELFRLSDDLVGEAHARTNLADVHTRLGRYRAAADHLHRVLDLARTLGNDDAEARAFNGLGLLHTRADEHDEAARMHRSALAIAEQSRDQQAQAWAHNGIGEALRGLDRPADALTHHRAAHAVAVAIGAADQHARAHTGLGAAHRDLGDMPAARRHHGRARLLYREIGVPEPG